MAIKPTRFEHPAPVIIEAIDGTKDPEVVLFSYELPFEWGLDVQDFMERAFVYAQSQEDPDPIIFALKYFGYSEVPNFPGYLGYEIESIGTGARGVRQNGADGAYWELFVDDTPSPVGSDTMRPEPGSRITWKFMKFSPEGPKSLRSNLAAKEQGKL